VKYGDPGRRTPGKPADVGLSRSEAAPLPDGGSGPPPPRLSDGSGLAAAATHRSWSGPLPAPDILGEYERQMPGAAERILSFAMRLTTAMIGISAVFFSLAVARVGNTSAAMAGGSVFLSVPVIMLFRAFITSR